MQKTAVLENSGVSANVKEQLHRDLVQINPLALWWFEFAALACLNLIHHQKERSSVGERGARG
jgi:hypothetical protein